MTSIPPQDPGTDPVRIDFWRPFKGLDLTSLPSEIEHEYASDVNNFRTDETGSMTIVNIEQVFSTLVGGEIGETLFVLNDADGRIRLVCATQTGFQVSTDSSGWIQLTGTPLTDCYKDDRFSMLRWGKYVLASNNVTFVQKLDVDNRTYTEIVGSPEGAMHLAGLSNRVIATRPANFPGEIHWSVKNNSDDWTGLGSGFEDLLSHDGNETDRPWSTWPISETEAIILCERGLYLMSATDNFDAPFRFSRIPGEGTPTPFSAAAIPGGIIYAGWTDFFIASRSGATPIGNPRIASFVFSGTGIGSPVRWKTFGCYVPILGEYWCQVTNLVDATALWRYNLIRQTWTKSTRLGDNMVYAENFQTEQYDRITGTYDSKSGTIDDLIGNNANIRVASVFSVDGTTGFVWHSSSILGSVKTASATTGDLELEQADNTLTVQYVSLVYSHSNTLTFDDILIEYSLDGSVWTTYGVIVPLVATGLFFSNSFVGTIDKVLTGKYVKFRVSLSSNTYLPYNFRVIKLSVYASKGPTARNG